MERYHLVWVGVSRSFGTTLIFVRTNTNPGLARRSSGGLEKSVLAYAQDECETGQKAWPFFQSRWIRTAFIHCEYGR